MITWIHPSAVRAGDKIAVEMLVSHVTEKNIAVQAAQYAPAQYVPFENFVGLRARAFSPGEEIQWQSEDCTDALVTGKVVATYRDVLWCVPRGTDDPVTVALSEVVFGTAATEVDPFASEKSA